MRVLRAEDLAIKLVPGIVVGGELRPPGYFAQGIHAPFALADDAVRCAQFVWPGSSVKRAKSRAELAQLQRLPSLPQQFSLCGARLCRPDQPQRLESGECLVLCGRAAAGRDDTAALRVTMRIAVPAAQYGARLVTITAVRCSGGHPACRRAGHPARRNGRSATLKRRPGRQDAALYGRQDARRYSLAVSGCAAHHGGQLALAPRMDSHEPACGNGD